MILMSADHMWAIMELFFADRVAALIRDARTPQSGEIVFNTMRYRSSETVQRSGYFQNSVSYIKLQIMFK